MSYKDMYNKMITGQDRYEAANPVSAGIGGLAGSVISTVPVARAFPALFGGSGFWGQTAAGGAIGGTDAAIRSGFDPGATAVGAGIGAAGPTMGQILAPVGQLAGAGVRWATDKIPGVNTIAPRVLPPSTPEILAAAETKYNNLGSMANYDPAVIKDLGTLTKWDIKTGSIGTPKSAPATHKIINDMGNMPPNPASLHNTRKQLGSVIEKDPGSAEGQSAILAKERIDNFLENPPPNAVATAPGVQPSDVYRTLQEANADWRTGLNSNNWRNRITAAIEESKTANQIPFMAEGQALRKNAANFVKNQNAMKFMRPEDRAALGEVAPVGSLGELGLRIGGGLSGTSRINFHTLLPFGGAYALTDPLTATAIMAGGTAATAGSSALTRLAAERADNVIRSASPYAQQQMAQQVAARTPIPGAPSIAPRSTLAPSAQRDEIARILALQLQRQATESGNAP
jgi:hypothetical protein